MKELQVAHRRIAADTDCYVIAEIGHNHQGELDRAKALFRAAKECGADAVKLQKRSNRTLFTREYYDRPYDNDASFGATYGAHREFLEFGWQEYLELQRYAAELEITFFATAFDLHSADFLEKLDVPAYKIASGDLKNLPLLLHVASFGKPMLISTGGGALEDVRRVYEAVRERNDQVCFLQCTASYPTEPEEMNLRVLETYAREFPDVVLGLSDHHNGIVMAVAAYLLGARVIEKHFTLNHTWKGSDHALSLEPIGMRKMVRDLQRVRRALGDGRKRVLDSERSALQKMGKKLVAARDLPAGHVLALADLVAKSPGDGIAPLELPALIGRRLLGPLAEDATLRPEMVEVAQAELHSAAV